MGGVTDECPLLGARGFNPFEHLVHSGGEAGDLVPGRWNRHSPVEVTRSLQCGHFGPDLFDRSQCSTDEEPDEGGQRQRQQGNTDDEGAGEHRDAIADLVQRSGNGDRVPTNFSDYDTKRLVIDGKAEISNPAMQGRSVQERKRSLSGWRLTQFARYRVAAELGQEFVSGPGRQHDYHCLLIINQRFDLIGLSLESRVRRAHEVPSHDAHQED